MTTRNQRRIALADGYSGVENALFYQDNCKMLYGSAQQVASELITQIKAM